MLVAIEKACTFTVPSTPEGGAIPDRVRAKPGETLDLPYAVAMLLVDQGLATLPEQAGVPEAVGIPTEPEMPVSDAAGPFAAMPVEQPTEPVEDVVTPINRFAPTPRPGGLRAFIREAK